MPVVAGTGFQFSLSEIRDRVRAFLMQTTAANSRWTDANINHYINQALDDLRNAGICETARGSFTTTAGDQTQILPATVWKILNMTYDEQWLTQVTFEDLLAMTGGNLDSSSGTPTYFAVEQNDDGVMIRFDCTFGESGKTVAYWYMKRPQDLSADGDLTGLYKSFSSVLVYRVLVLCAKADGNGREAADWGVEYERALGDAQGQNDAPAESDGPQCWDPYGWTRR